MKITITRTEAGSRLRSARLAAGLTQAGAARALGMGPPALADLESGRRVCSWPTLVEIVATLGLDPRAIVPEFFEGAPVP